MAYDSLFDGVCSGAVPWGVLMLDILVSPGDGLGVLGVLPAYVSIRQHTSAYVSIRQHTSAYVSVRQRTSAYVSIRQHTSARHTCQAW
jgi:hypothetical protein